MTIEVKIVPALMGFKAEIISGFHKGKFICHSQTDFPVVWPDKQKMISWLKETGYTVKDDAK